jgi:hypothetical protein
MLRGRRTAIAAALAAAAAAAVAAGCGGGTNAGALPLDPVAAAATKTQHAGAARIRFAVAFSNPMLQGKTFRLRGTGVIDGTSAEMTFNLRSLLRQGGSLGGANSDLNLPYDRDASVTDILLEQHGDYVIYLRLGFLSAQIPGGKQWLKVDLSKLGKSAGLDLGKLLSGSQLQPSDVLSMLRGEGATIRRVGPATVGGVATTHYRVTVDVAKALQSRGLTSPLLGGFAAQMPKLPEDVWIGRDGLVRQVRLSYSVTQGGQRVRLGMTMELYDYGAHVSIAAPPSSEVFDATRFAQQDLGSALH